MIYLLLFSLCVCVCVCVCGSAGRFVHTDSFLLVFCFSSLSIDSSLLDHVNE